MKKISIIIPHYNSPISLKRLLDSIPKLSYIETIVIDDNSNLSIIEFELLKNENYNHINFLTNSSNNKGAGACRNIGINEAKGEWILFADSDDYFVGNFESLIKNSISKNRDSDVIFFRPISEYINSNKISNRHKVYERLVVNYIKFPNLENELNLRYKFSVPWSKMIKKKLIVDNGIYFEEIIVANDVLFSTKIGHAMKSFEVSNDVIYVVTESDHSLTKTNSDLYLNCRFREFIKNYEYINTNIGDKKLFIKLNFTGLEILIKAYKSKVSIGRLIKMFYILKSKNIKVLNKSGIHLLINKLIRH